MTEARWLWTVGARMWRGSSARRDAGPAAASCGSSSLRDRDPAGQRLPQKDEGQAECCRRASTLSSMMHAPYSSSMMRIMTDMSVSAARSCLADVEAAEHGTVPRDEAKAGLRLV